MDKHLLDKHWLWTPEEDRRLIELIKCGCSQSQAAEKLTEEFKLLITRDAVKNRYARIENHEHERSDGNMFPDYLYELDEDSVSWPDMIRKRNDIHRRFAGQKLHIVSFSDLHSPLIDFRGVEKIIREQTPETKRYKSLGYKSIAVVNGDLYDFPQFSKFEKDIRIDLRKETTVADEFLRVLTEHYQEVVVILGNHCYRLFKYIRQMTEKAPEVKEYFESKLDPLLAAQEKYKNLIYHSHNEIEIGKTVFSHPFHYNQPTLRTVENEMVKVLSHRHRYADPDVQAVIIGHTHQAGSAEVNGVKGIEQGHCTLKPDYNVKNKPKRDWSRGYATVVMDQQGNIDPNETRYLLV